MKYKPSRYYGPYPACEGDEAVLGVEYPASFYLVVIRKVVGTG